MLFAAFAVACADGTTPTASIAPSAAVEAKSGQVRVLTGGPHTVHHSEAALPTAEAPQSDGKPTLIWFSATWCTTCASMEAWATDVGNEFAGRAAFVEKSVDHDRAAVSRYGVRGTPTFVVIDASGREVTRFFAPGSTAAFRTAIEQALGKAGV